ncbi:hypothetical protein BJ138DRAFT_1112828 [Hygrophoropsis aurantiaca]|uniref:Uncharacterized protein n=1 Tax=Hygrophoropsis aurantiaca TaxID=72124 RepID=A0ACB8AFG5_9AGAM|nr:hypothetical protein BJ138DRAFT_1112828 [Hygrophoropsis aurantiaca]
MSKSPASLQEVQPPVVTGNPPQPGPSSPRSRTGSLSSSFLDLPAAGPSNQLQSNQPPRHDGFWDTSDIDLPARARPQISSISRAKPSDASPPTLEHAARELHPPASRFEPLVRLWNQRAPVGQWTHRKSREDRDGPHEMQPTQLPPISTPPANVPDMKPPPRLPRTSSFRTAKVSAAHGFSRTHAVTADADDKVSRWDYICYCMCCPCKRADSESDVESDTGP